MPARAHPAARRTRRRLPLERSSRFRIAHSISNADQRLTERIAPSGADRRAAGRRGHRGDGRGRPQRGPQPSSGVHHCRPADGCRPTTVRRNGQSTDKGYRSGNQSEDSVISEPMINLLDYNRIWSRQQTDHHKVDKCFLSKIGLEPIGSDGLSPGWWPANGQRDLAQLRREFPSPSVADLGQLIARQRPGPCQPSAAASGRSGQLRTPCICTGTSIISWC